MEGTLEEAKLLRFFRLGFFVLVDEFSDLLNEFNQFLRIVLL